MPHIHTQTGQHDHTAGAYIIRTDFDQPKIMLHVHRKIGKLLQFGGHIELNETPWHAITHELEEESGYRLSELQLLQPHRRILSFSDNAIIHPQPIAQSTTPYGESFDHFHTEVAYAFTASAAPKHTPKEGESTNIKLYSRDELLALSNAEIIENVREIALFVLDYLLPEWDKVDPKSYL